MLNIRILNISWQNFRNNFHFHQHLMRVFISVNQFWLLVFVVIFMFIFVWLLKTVWSLMFIIDLICDCLWQATILLGTFYSFALFLLRYLDCSFWFLKGLHIFKLVTLCHISWNIVSLWHLLFVYVLDRDLNFILSN